jgi:hypothetical protein
MQLFAVASIKKKKLLKIDNTLGFENWKKRISKRDFEGKRETGRGITVPQRPRQIRTGQKCLKIDKMILQNFDRLKH